MESSTQRITVQAHINAPVDQVWTKWNEPQHVMQWCQASDDWHAPAATNDLRTGGSFSTTMAAKDGSFSFEFGGVYSAVELHKSISYEMSDGRKVDISFASNGTETTVSEMFDPETINPLEMQQAGWQAILNSFKAYVEKA